MGISHPTCLTLHLAMVHIYVAKIHGEFKLTGLHTYMAGTDLGTEETVIKKKNRASRSAQCVYDKQRQ